MIIELLAPAGWEDFRQEHMNNCPDPVVFYVSAGESVCVDCFDMLERWEWLAFTPVRASGEGNDGFGLVCACGEEHVFSCA